MRCAGLRCSGWRCSDWRWIGILLAVSCCGAVGQRCGTLQAAEPVDFAADVLPLLQQRCHGCHGGVRRKSGLSLLTRGEALRPASSGAAAIVPGEPHRSELVRRVEASDESQRMPPSGKPLSEAETDMIRRWIAAGAPWPRHWAFEPVRRPAVAEVEPLNWGRNPIDAFVLEALQAKALGPAPQASRPVLIRRLYLDLIGLLPSPAETEAFCRDSRPDAYHRLVDRLLANPHFGERWGRHWLDLARYADSDGFEVDGPRPFAWRWRDWVIAAFNRDMPFDEFTVEQLAGDLLTGATDMQKLATAFHRQSLTNKEGGIDKEEARYIELVDRVNAAGTTWLGLTIGCAQCHDHPYDPFTQKEYYQLYAFFHDTDDTELPLPASHRLPSPKRKAGSHPIQARVVTQSEEERVTTTYHRGDFLQPGDAVQPGVPRHLASRPDRSGKAERPDRLDLARWLIAPDNPLTSRVAANQVWLRLFGAGLVRTPSDFGTRGESPTHPRLLDYLAGQYRTYRWSTKRLIREIVTSATYRQASRHRPQIEAADPRNRLWHRQNRYRVEAELIRDISLTASGLLSRQIGGPSVYPPMAEEVAKLSFRSNYDWPTSTGADRYRRGLYIFFKRTLPYPNLDSFDCPDATTASMQRNASNTPLQALMVLNNEAHVEAARAFTRRVLGAAGSDSARLEVAFRICLSRAPSKAEQQRMLGLLAASRDFYRDHAQEAEQLIGDQPAEAAASEAAAWFATLSVLLNLDEFLTRE